MNALAVLLFVVAAVYAKDDCTDEHELCSFWATQFDQCNQNAVWMKPNCPASCGKCTGEKKVVIAKCNDEDELCAKFAANGECEKSPDYMFWKCQKACKFCTGEGPQPYPKALQARGEKHEGNRGGKSHSHEKKGSHSHEKKGSHEKKANGGEMKHQEAGGAAECTDHHDLCPFWKSLGECTANPNYMLRTCKASCNECSPKKIKIEKCASEDANCDAWKAAGECDKPGPFYMFWKCEKTCGYCSHDGEVIDYPKGLINAAQPANGQLVQPTAGSAASTTAPQTVPTQPAATLPPVVANVVQSQAATQTVPAVVQTQPPTPGSSQPPVTQPAPVATQPAPAATQPAPVATQPAPVATQPAPVTTQPAATQPPAPATTLPPAPVVTTQSVPAPIATQPAAAVTQQAPAVQTTQSVPAPIATQPAAAVTQQAPAVQTTQSQTAAPTTQTSAPTTAAPTTAAPTTQSQPTTAAAVITTSAAAAQTTQSVPVVVTTAAAGTQAPAATAGSSQAPAVTATAGSSQAPAVQATTVQFSADVKPSVAAAGDCTDKHRLCAFWKSIGECSANPTWMVPNCAASCKSCTPSRVFIDTCADTDPNCAAFGAQGECNKSFVFYMFWKCPKTCNFCTADKTEIDYPAALLTAPAGTTAPKIVHHL